MLAEEAPESAAPGRAVVLALRPEALRLGPADGAREANAMPVDVCETAYLGEVVQQRVGLHHDGASAEFRVFELRPTVVARDGRSEPAVLSIAPDDVVILVD
jgi:ABC-type Fe3+/spermidine/putrescine transport system ATPase subunit